MYLKYQRENALLLYDQCKSIIQDMKLEIDILKETLDVLKKDHGVDMATLKNREKAVIISVLKDKYSLPLLLRRLRLSKCSNYYQMKQMNSPNKYTALLNRIIELFAKTSNRYGYRRIHALLA
jgi:hypothetical protein